VDDINKTLSEPINLIKFQKTRTKLFVPLTIIGGGDGVLISSLIKVGSVCACSGVLFSLSSTERHALIFEVTNRGLLFFDMASSSDKILLFLIFIFFD